MLTDICQRNGWEIVRTFENKVSGAKKNEERQEIVELVDYVRNNQVDMVVATEVSRLGRDTLEALKTIETLSEHKVNLFFANYGLETLLPDGTINPIARLILTICLEISSYERNLIRFRMKVGYENYQKQCREQGIKMGRPATYKKSEEQYREQYCKELSLMRKGISLRNISKITGVSTSTLLKIKSFL